MRYNLTDSRTITVVTSDCSLITVSSDHPNHADILQALQAGNEAAFLALYSCKIKDTLQLGFEFEFGMNKYSNELTESLIQHGFRQEGALGALYYPKLKDLYVGSDGSVYPDEPYEVSNRAPIAYDEAMSMLHKFFQWMEYEDAITDRSCGLHVNISFVEQELNERLNLGKLIHLFDEDKITKTFDRSNNEYCVRWNQTNLYKDFDPINYNEIDQVLRNDRWENYSQKYRSVNINNFVYPTGQLAENPRIEFRCVGGENYHLRHKEVKESVEHMVDCMRKSTSIKETVLAAA